MRAVAIERRAERLTEEWGDLGPHVVFCDAPEQRIIARITRTPGETEEAFDAALAPGAACSLSFRASMNASAAGAARVFFSGVITLAKSELHEAKGATQVIELVGVSSNGVDSPLVIVE
ncbi:MAG: hypothetical protein VYC34_10775, partial [Planctomycetota bacterium]|nr:hypothetical protein [Planctomycetota bacterium]